MNLPIVAIVGRPNVGKSSLLNCLAGRRIAIVDPTPGVTRDRIGVPIACGEGTATRYFELVDTGGVGIVDSQDLNDHVEAQIDYAINEADAIVYVVDAREGVTPLDKRVAQRLRRSDKKVLFIANKADQPNLLLEEGDLMRLGFGQPLTVSAKHTQNIEQMLEKIVEMVADKAPASLEESVMQLAIVGKRNAGKSTMINALAGEQRVIVSEKAGTTRDSVDVTIRRNGKTFTLIDTAGVRKRRKLADSIEFYSQHRSMRSVRRADVVAFLIDASLPVSQVDKELAGAIAEANKPVVLVINKWDLAEKEGADPEAYADYLAKSFPELRFAPISLTVATEDENLDETVELAESLYEQANTHAPTSLLNDAIEHILADRGPSHKAGTRRPKIYFASQIDVAPPTIVLFVNDVRSFDQSYQRFLVNRLRDFVPYPEVPIKLVFRTSRKGAQGGKGSRG